MMRRSRPRRRTWSPRRPGPSASSPTATRSPTRCSTRSRRPTRTSSSRSRPSTRTRPPRRSSPAASRPTWSRSAPTRWSRSLARNLIRPVDPEAFDQFDKLAFSDADEVRDENGEVLFVPASAGPHGLIVNTDELGTEIDSYQALFDPANAGQVALEATPLTAIAASALALGLDDPMNLTDEEVEQAKQNLLENRDNFRAFAESDASMVNLFKSGEVLLADGGRGTAEAMIDDGLPVEWVAPDRGRALVGMRARDHLEGGEHRRRLQADRLLRLARGAGDLRRDGLRRDEPRRAGAARREVPGLRGPDEPRGRDRRRPSPRTPTSTTAHGRKSSPNSDTHAPRGARGGQRRPGRRRARDPVRAGADAGAVLVQRLLDHLAALGGLHHPLVRGRVEQRAGARRDRELARRRVVRHRDLARPRDGGRLGPHPAALLRPRRGRRAPRLRAGRALADHRRRRA